MYLLAQEIGKEFQEKGIRKGTIFKTDKPLSEYVSYRHPGKEYQDAVAVDSYNPDNVPDPLLLVCDTDEKIRQLNEKLSLYTNEQSTFLPMINNSIAFLETVKAAYEKNEIPEPQARQLIEASFEVANNCTAKTVSAFQTLEKQIRKDPEVPLNIKTELKQFWGRVCKSFGEFFKVDAWIKKGEALLSNVARTEKFKSDFKQLKGELQQTGNVLKEQESQEPSPSSTLSKL
jgi:hypothetical protein